MTPSLGEGHMARRQVIYHVGWTDSGMIAWLGKPQQWSTDCFIVRSELPWLALSAKPVGSPLGQGTANHTPALVLGQDLGYELGSPVGITSAKSQQLLAELCCLLPCRFVRASESVCWRCRCRFGVRSGCGPCWLLRQEYLRNDGPDVNSAYPRAVSRTRRAD